VVVLDTRSRAHQHASPSSADDPRDTNSFEWAISATASVATHLLGNGREVSLVVGGAGARHTSTDSAALLDALAALESQSSPDLSDLLDPLRDVGHEATVIAIVGRLDPVSLRTLSRIHPRGAVAPAFAIVLDTPTWANKAGSDPAVPHAMETLRASGWSVVSARAGDKVPAIWAGLISQRSTRPTFVGESI
jgi:uncharacterized protein (DUF58 family)